MPDPLDDEVTVGKPKLIPDTDLTKLNDPLHTVGYAEGIDLLKVSMRDMIEHNHDDRNILQCE